ncbi:MAG: EamA family transporter [Planctomycetota bacterium]
MTQVKRDYAPHETASTPATGEGLRSPIPGLNRHAAGMFFCALASLSYTLANVCMRKLSELSVPESLAIFSKESLPAVVLGLGLAWALARRRKCLPPWKIVIEVVFVALAVQLVANVGVQWAMGVIGLAINVPVNLGAMLVATALFGSWILRERVSRRTWCAVALLIGALVVLGLSAARIADRTEILPAEAGQTLIGTASVAPASELASAPPRLILAAAAAVFASILGGCIYATLSLTLRRHATNRDQALFVMFVVTGMGGLTLGLLSLWNIEFSLFGSSVEFSGLNWRDFAAIPPNQCAWMIVAGLANLGGFVAIAIGLQLIPIVHASVFNASQVALAAIAGVVFFPEPVTAGLLAGVALTVVGITLIDPPE